MKLFYLSSKHLSRGTNSNFTAPLNRTLTVAEGARFRIDQLRLGVAFMLVNQDNRYLFFKEGDVVGIAILELGQYDSQTMATTLGFVLNNGAPKLKGNLTVEYSIISGSTTLMFAPPASNQNSTFAILSDQEIAQLSLAALQQSVAAYPAAVSALGNLTLSIPKSFNSVLGDYTIDYVNAYKVLTFRFISTQPYDTLFLCSHKLGNSSIQGPRGSCTTLMQIVVNTPFGGVQEASMPTDVWISSPGLTCNELDFQLEDARGHIVDMSMGGEISFLLTIDDNQ